MAFTLEEQGQLLVEIAEISNYFTPRGKVKSVNGDDLSAMGVRLAALKAAVIDLKVQAEQDMLELDVQADEARATAYEKAKEAVNATAAGELYKKDPDYVAAKQAANHAKVEFNRLKSVLSDAHDLIESFTGRMIELHGARKDERIG